MESESSTPKLVSISSSRRKKPTRITWVSVEERLPEPFDLVLVHYTETDDEGTEGFITLGALTHKGAWVTNGGELIETEPSSIVTEWAFVNDPSGEVHQI